MKKKIKLVVTKVNEPEDFKTLKRLIDKALDRYGAEDVLKAFFSTLNFGYEDEIAASSIAYCKDELVEILKDEIIEDNKEAIIEDARFDDRGKGFIVLQIQSLDKRSRLEDFLCKEIYPFYNEQQSELYPFN